MEARGQRAIVAMALTFVLYSFGPFSGSGYLLAAGYRTTNFVVAAPTPELAKEIGDAAEVWRKELSIEWLGEEMPSWAKPCPIHAQVSPGLGAGGATSFVFDRGEVFGWKMNIQGSRERVLDSVLPHEVTHTIFASYFRQPLPRWADEGACTTVEHRSEVAKQERMLIDFLKTGRGIPFDQMFAMKDYPQDVMPLYSQGHSLAQYLIESRGRKAFIDFLSDGLQDENWPRAVEKHYGFHDLYVLQDTWLNWVKQGRPRLTPAASPAGQLASNTTTAPARSGEPMPIYRAQSPDDITPILDDASPSAVTPVSASSPSGSVYAAAAARARRNQPTNSPTPHSVGSVYDASRSAGVVRR
jgi:hypothetical protein